MDFKINEIQTYIWDALSEGVIITDPRQNDNPIVYVNSAFTTITGFQADEVLGKNCRFLSINSEIESSKQLKEAIASNRHCKVTLKNSRKNGTVFWNDLSVSPIFNENKELIYFLGIQRDVTSEKELDENLKHASALFESVVKNVPGVVYQWVEENNIGRFTFVSEKLWTYFGVKPENMDSFPSLIHPDDISRWRQSINDANKNSEDWFFEGRLLYPDNSIKWWQGFSKKISSSDNISIYNGFMLDVTERKLLELELEQERKKLQNSAKMISLGEMSAGVAHEINNPLSVITGSTGLIQKALLKNPPDLNQVKEYLDKIQRMTTRIAKIVKSLKQFSRDDQLDPLVIYSLNTIVEDTIEFIDTRIDNSGVKISISMNQNLNIWCRPVQISQVLLNIISNAIDATENSEEKWIRISVTLENNFVKIRVIDSGPGIPAAIRDRIMNPFFTTKEVGKGTGLGLSLSKGIIEDHGGAMVLDMTGPNTCFLIEIPAAD